jgi:hypothetical protein
MAKKIDIHKIIAIYPPWRQRLGTVPQRFTVLGDCPRAMF